MLNEILKSNYFLLLGQNVANDVTYNWNRAHMYMNSLEWCVHFSFSRQQSGKFELILSDLAEKKKIPSSTGWLSNTHLPNLSCTTIFDVANDLILKKFTFTSNFWFFVFKIISAKMVSKIAKIANFFKSNQIFSYIEIVVYTKFEVICWMPWGNFTAKIIQQS